MKKYSPTNLNRSLFLQTQIFFILEIKKYDINEKHIYQEKLKRYTNMDPTWKFSVEKR